MIRILTILTIPIMFLISYTNVSEGADLGLSKIKFYGYFTGGKNITNYIDDQPIKVKEGETLRHEFNKFDKVEGVIADNMDVETTVYNRGKQAMTDIEVRLSISPKVTYFVYVKDYPEKLWNSEEMERTAEWFAPIVLLRNKIKKLDAGASSSVVFEKINIGKIVDEYLKKELWPIEFEFTMSIEPVGGEGTFKNNTERRTLKIPVPVY
ncbi:MAG: hypothetical protein AB1442_07105 [Nitrospirota bacterium]